MKRDIHEMLNVLQAFANGALIEYRVHNAMCGTGNWHTCANPSWDWSAHEYRIRDKPDLAYVLERLKLHTPHALVTANLPGIKWDDLIILARELQK